MNVYGELTSAQLENRTSDYSLAAATTGRMWYRTDLTAVRVDRGGTIDTLLCTGNANTLAQFTTPANPAAGFNKIYPKSDNNFYSLNSSGTELRLLTPSNLTVPTFQKFIGLTQTGWLVSITAPSSNIVAGAVYTNNGNSYTIANTVTTAMSAYVLFLVGTSTLTSTGSSTLTYSSGTGPATITFSGTGGTSPPVFAATYTLPSNPTPLYLRVQIVGGGGGGGAAVTNSGAAGGPTGFSGFITAAGGGGGGPQNAAGGLGGGTTVNASISGVGVTGGCGGPGQNTSASVNLAGGMGGSSFFGGAGAGASDGVAGINAASGSGSGGGGGSVGSAEGGSGGGSGGYAEALIPVSSLFTTIMFAVGAGGAGGQAGTEAGGNGGTGQVIVWEYYQ